MKRTIRLNESELKRMISESVKRALNETSDPIVKIQTLIQQANDAYHNASNMQGNNEWPLMDKQGNPYGLSGDIKLDGKGYVSIPLNGGSYSEYQPVNIRVLRKIGGKLQIIKGDYFDEGWRDVAKILKKIIKDAEIGIGNFKEYDPNWEISDSPEELKANKAALRDMNKKIGRKSSVGIDNLSESKLNSIVSKSLGSVLRENAYDYYADAEDRYLMRERLPKGWEKHETEDGVIYTDPDYNEYVKDEYGNFEPLN